MYDCRRMGMDGKDYYLWLLTDSQTIRSIDLFFKGSTIFLNQNKAKTAACYGPRGVGRVLRLHTVPNESMKWGFGFY